MDRLPDFRPAPWLPGGDLQTIVPALWPTREPSGRSEPFVVHVAPGAALRLDVDWPVTRGAATLVLIHGMCGSSASPHVRRTTQLALDRGWCVVRMNLRTCGGTERLSETLYNAGQSGDLEQVLVHLERRDFPRPYFVGGFSLGGNIALRYAGRRGPEALADALAGVNPPIDLAWCCREIERPRNRLYQRHYVRGLRRQLMLHRAAHGDDRDVPAATEIRSVRGFDERFTAPDAGYPSAAAYYADASAGPTLDGAARRLLVLSAANDPFVPPSMFDALRGRTQITLLQPARGGHCGYWQARRPRFWAAEAMLAFFADN